MAVGMGGAGTGDGTDATWTSEAEGLRKPALRCSVRGGIRDGKQVNIYWHGVILVFRIPAWVDGMVVESVICARESCA